MRSFVPVEPLARLAVDPGVLVAARNRVSLSTAEAATRASGQFVGEPGAPFDAEEMASLESGQPPTIPQLEALAATYLTSFVSLVSGDLSAPRRRDFRRLADAQRSPLSYDALRRLAQFGQFYDLAQRLTRVLGTSEEVSVPAYSWSGRPSADEIEHLASIVRSTLGVTPETQQGWASDEKALDFWIESFQGAGIFVFRQPLSVDDLRGASRWDRGGPPSILINSSDTITAQIFTGLHEFAHLMIRSSDSTNICDIAGPLADEEWFANRLSSATLLPRDMLSRALPTWVGSKRYCEWPWRTKRKLRRTFNVSNQVIGIRLKELSYVTDSGYRPFWRVKPAPARARPFQRWQRYQRNLGNRAIDLAATALAEKRISPAELSRTLGLKLSEVETLVGVE